MPDQPTAVPIAAPPIAWVEAHLDEDGGYRTRLTARTHAFAADEPADVGGADTGPTPYELLIGALAACTAMTVRMYASRKRWPLRTITVRMRPVRAHAADCERCETEEVSAGRLEREVEFVGDLTDEQRARLLYIADRCPVKQSLERGLQVHPATVTPTPVPT